jgi:CopG family transcriptional regulator / antitoxin EndoAI
VYKEYTMKKSSTQKRKRINITLPEQTIRLIDRVAEKGERSYVIDEALHFFVEQTGKDRLREQLRKGAVARAERDLQIAEEWFGVDDEAWK